jgi:hypothetical protein
MEVSGQFHAPATLPPGEIGPGTHWIGGWVGPRAVWTLYRGEKSLAPAANRNSVVQPTALPTELSRLTSKVCRLSSYCSGNAKLMKKKFPLQLRFLYQEKPKSLLKPHQWKNKGVTGSRVSHSMSMWCSVCCHVITHCFTHSKSLYKLKNNTHELSQTAYQQRMESS